jgi:hypothetical protein
LADSLSRIPNNATILMYEGSYVGALQRVGIPLKRVVSEVSHPDWEWALLDPAVKSDYIAACQGDPVWMAAKEHHSELRELLTITVPGEQQCRIYMPTSRSALPQTP